jgi:hypothetical protein
MAASPLWPRDCAALPSCVEEGLVGRFCTLDGHLYGHHHHHREPLAAKGFREIPEAHAARDVLDFLGSMVHTEVNKFVLNSLPAKG